jgi:hypothetical protein
MKNLPELLGVSKKLLADPYRNFQPPSVKRLLGTLEIAFAEEEKRIREMDRYDWFVEQIGGAMKPYIQTFALVVLACGIGGGLAAWAVAWIRVL